MGTQVPFDRLIEMVDQIAPELDTKVFAQTGRGRYVPKNMDWRASVDAEEFDRMLLGARIIVAHAGIGTVLKAYKYAKPAVLVPRVAALGEHRNDHQLATVSQLRNRTGIYVATMKDELAQLLRSDLQPAAPSESVFAQRARLQNHVNALVQQALERRNGPRFR